MRTGSQRRPDRVAGYLPFNELVLLRDASTKVASMLDRADVHALPHGIVHGDLFRDNALFNEHGLSGVLDFHHAAESYLLFDLAVVANDWCTDVRGVLNPERTTALLMAYHQVRRLTKRELWFLSPASQLYAALAFWLSRLVVQLPGRNASCTHQESGRVSCHRCGAQRAFLLSG